MPDEVNRVMRIQVNVSRDEAIQYPWVMELWDAHCHLQDTRLAGRLPDVIRRAREAGIVSLVSCGSSESDWPELEQVASDFPWILPSFGLHPLYTRARSAGWRSILEVLLVRYPAAGVGEIGLDGAIVDRNEADQERVFMEQLELAITLKRPVSIHCRQAWGRMVDCLKRVGPIPAGGVVHSYSGSPELVETLCQANLSISFSGSITRSHNSRGIRSCRQVPPPRLLIETDSPDLYPVIDGKGPCRGMLNEPATLPYVLRAVAEIRGMTVETCARLTSRNTASLFRIAPSVTGG